MSMFSNTALRIGLARTTERCFKTVVTAIVMAAAIVSSLLIFIMAGLIGIACLFLLILHLNDAEGLDQLLSRPGAEFNIMVCSTVFLIGFCLILTLLLTHPRSLSSYLKDASPYGRGHKSVVMLGHFTMDASKRGWHLSDIVISKIFKSLNELPFNGSHCHFFKTTSSVLIFPLLGFLRGAAVGFFSTPLVFLWMPLFFMTGTFELLRHATLKIRMPSFHTLSQGLHQIMHKMETALIEEGQSSAAFAHKEKQQLDVITHQHKSQIQPTASENKEHEVPSTQRRL